MSVPRRSGTALYQPPPLTRERVWDQTIGHGHQHLNGLYRGRLIHPPASEPAWRRLHLLPQAPVHGVEGRGQEREAQRS